jgi:hypothetical protein
MKLKNYQKIKKYIKNKKKKTISYHSLLKIGFVKRRPFLKIKAF